MVFSLLPSGRAFHVVQLQSGPKQLRSWLPDVTEMSGRPNPRLWFVYGGLSNRQVDGSMVTVAEISSDNHDARTARFDGGDLCQETTAAR
jgi:hypothetical protein